MKLTMSHALYQRALKVIPLATQTLSKSVSQFVQGVAPIYVTRGDGPFLWDADGNRWIDFIAALGPVVLGYADPRVNKAISAQLEDGMSFSLSHVREIDLAETLCALIPGVEQVRFAKNGSDVTTAAVRAARAYTGRDHVAMCGYHGWHDWTIGTTARSKGVPKSVSALSHTFAYNDLGSLEKIFSEFPGQVAAVIMESVGVHAPIGDFLAKVKTLAHRHGAVLVFDEIVNGFRLAPGGGGQFFGVVPDLIAIGKAMGNGAPISAIGGSREVMRAFDEVFFSFTFGGDTIGIAAALTTIEILEAQNGCAELQRLGKRLQDGFNERASRHGLAEVVRCIGLPHHTVVEFTGTESDALLKKSFFQQSCLVRGVLFLGIHFTTLSHSEAVIDETLAVYEEALAALADALRSGDLAARLVGPPVQPVFRCRV